MRIEQWIKNIFIALPLFFAHEFTSVPKLLACFISVLGFGFVASSIYCLNDIYDIQADSVHPKKCKRPLASGQLSKQTGIAIMILSLLIGLCIIYLWGGNNSLYVICMALGYYLLNILYTLWLKHIAIIDVIIISFGFVIRVVIGGIATDIPLSHWIVLMTFLISLFIAFAKRRDDFVIYDKSGVIARRNIILYNFEFLNAALIITSTVTIVSYIMYTVSPEVTLQMNSEYVYTTSIFVLAGILRYLQLTFVEGKSGSPTQVLMKDRFIQCCILCWILLFAIIMY